MKKLILFFTTAFCVFLISYVPLWWGILLATFLVQFLLAENWRQATTISFFATLCSLFVRFYMINQSNNKLLASKVANLFSLQSEVVLIFLSAIIFSILCSISGVTGYYFQNVITIKKKTKSKYL